jgi:hypothetical protein
MQIVPSSIPPLHVTFWEIWMDRSDKRPQVSRFILTICRHLVEVALRANHAALFYSGRSGPPEARNPTVEGWPTVRPVQ